MAVAFDRPVRDVQARTGTRTNCFGIAQIVADFEPADSFRFENADDGRWTGGSEAQLVDLCVAAVQARR